MSQKPPFRVRVQKRVDAFFGGAHQWHVEVEQQARCEVNVAMPEYAYMSMEPEQATRRMAREIADKVARMVRDQIEAQILDHELHQPQAQFAAGPYPSPYTMQADEYLKMMGNALKPVYDPGPPHSYQNNKALTSGYPAMSTADYNALFGVEPTSNTGKGSNPAEILQEALPGTKTVVDLPCGCTKPKPITGAIIHLNDRHPEVWTRNKVADWLETLAVDLTFPLSLTAPPTPEGAHP